MYAKEKLAVTVGPLNKVVQVHVASALIFRVSWEVDLAVLFLEWLVRFDWSDLAGQIRLVNWWKQNKASDWF